MKRSRIPLAAALALLSLTELSAQQQPAAAPMTRQEYIARYSQMAVRERDLYGIPAAITMAQGLLESQNGNSRLATLGNNHFGIKCRDWSGPTMRHDDDAPQECFRTYADPEGSYRDHSEFLKGSARYAPLFNIPVSDYQGWAYGPKAAGYATNPAYATMLIALIEDNDLQRLDDPGYAAPAHQAAVDPGSRPSEQPALPGDPAQLNIPAGPVDIDNYTVSLRTHAGYALYPNNGSEFVVANSGDTWASIARSFAISVKKLLKFNDAISTSDDLPAGYQVYVRPKAKQANNGKLIHVASNSQTLLSVSQQYGVRLRNLARLNLKNPNAILSEGQQIRLK